jgi:hypothetical protein
MRCRGFHVAASPSAKPVFTSATTS